MVEVENDTVIMCDCGAHSLVLTHGRDGDFRWTTLAFWEMGHGDGHGLVDRIRHIWRIIRHGHPYGDMVCLDDREEVEKLRDALTKILEE